MNKSLMTLTATAALFCSTSVFATGLASCDSGPEENWIPSAELEKKLTDAAWQVRRIKVDAGCYEVYAMDENGERVEAYFDPLTLDPVATDGHEDEAEAETSE